MVNYCRVALVSAGLILLQQSVAASEVLKLVCVYSHTVDDRGQRVPAYGEALVTVNYVKDGHATLKKQGVGVEFSGEVSPEEIQGEARYKIQDQLYRETISINRFTGLFSATFGVLGRGGLTSFGVCRTAAMQIF